MKYDGGFIDVCPTCNNEEIEHSHNYCFICSENLENVCLNRECSMNNTDTSLKRSARYCPMCGHKSSYFDDNVIQAWDYEEHTEELFPIESVDDDIDLPF